MSNTEENNIEEVTGLESSDAAAGENAGQMIDLETGEEIINTTSEEVEPTDEDSVVDTAEEATETDPSGDCECECDCSGCGKSDAVAIVDELIERLPFLEGLGELADSVASKVGDKNMEMLDDVISDIKGFASGEKTVLDSIIDTLSVYEENEVIRSLNDFLRKLL